MAWCIVYVEDALCLLEAACTGIISFANERLTCQLVTFGSVYVVDARQSQIWHWTDGHHWKPHQLRSVLGDSIHSCARDNNSLVSRYFKQICDIVSGSYSQPTYFIKQIGQYIFNCTITDTDL